MRSTSADGDGNSNSNERNGNSNERGRKGNRRKVSGQCRNMPCVLFWCVRARHRGWQARINDDKRALIKVASGSGGNEHNERNGQAATVRGISSRRRGFF